MSVTYFAQFQGEGGKKLPKILILYLQKECTLELRYCFNFLNSTVSLNTGDPQGRHSIYSLPR